MIRRPLKQRKVAPVVINVNLGRELVRSRFDAPVSGKTPKGDVHYSRAVGADRCANCGHASPSPGPVTLACGVVEGLVNAGMWCDRWESPGDPAAGVGDGGQAVDVNTPLRRVAR